MVELDRFIKFLIDHISDDRIGLSKKMKYGYRYYYLHFLIDADPNDKNKGFGRFSGSVEIIFDNRNQCIEVIDGNTDKNYIVENSEILEKWNSILENIINSNMDDEILNLMEKSLSECHRKDLHREWKMKYLFSEDEENNESEI